MSNKSRKTMRQRRHERIRKRISGTADRPRMAIAVSNKHLYVQFIDDDSNRTLAAASSLSVGGAPCTVAGGKTVGEAAAKAAAAAGISRVVVDRGGFRYHGRVRAIVEAAAEGGLGIGIVVKADKPAKSTSGKPEQKDATAKAATAEQTSAGATVGAVADKEDA